MSLNVENNNQKIITYLIVYVVVPAALNTFTVMFSDKFIDNIFNAMLWQFIMYIGAILFFLPTYIISYFLFKKIQNIKTRYLLFSIFIPLTMFIYFLITYLPIKHNILNFSINIIFLIIGFYWMGFILPSSFITTLCTPKKYLEEKYYNLACIFLTEIFGIIFLIITIFIAGHLGLFN